MSPLLALNQDLFLLSPQSGVEAVQRLGPVGVSMKHARTIVWVAGGVALLWFVLRPAFTPYDGNGRSARGIKARDAIRQMSEGLEQQRLRHGAYPELRSWTEMADRRSPLVLENDISLEMPTLDPWGNPYRGSSHASGFRLSCTGDPRNPEDTPPFECSSIPGPKGGGVSWK